MSIVPLVTAILISQSLKRKNKGVPTEDTNKSSEITPIWCEDSSLVNILLISIAAAMFIVIAVAIYG